MNLDKLRETLKTQPDNELTVLLDSAEHTKKQLRSRVPESTDERSASETNEAIQAIIDMINEERAQRRAPAPQIQIQLNPHQHAAFTQYPEYWYLEQIGMLPDFLAYALEYPDTPLHETMHEAYGHGGSVMTGGTYGDNGLYLYPEDPELYPLAKITCTRGAVYVYLYGIVSIHEDGQAPAMYRFD